MLSINICSRERWICVIAKTDINFLTISRFWLKLRLKSNIVSLDKSLIYSNTKLLIICYWWQIWVVRKCNLSTDLNPCRLHFNTQYRLYSSKCCLPRSQIHIFFFLTCLDMINFLGFSEDKIQTQRLNNLKLCNRPLQRPVC